MTLILTDHSGATCHVYGYPGLAFFDGLPMATHLQALLTWRANTATGPAPFNPDIVHVTPPDEHAYLWAAWPGGPVLGGEIAAWPLRAAAAGPFPGWAPRPKWRPAPGQPARNGRSARHPPTISGPITNAGTGTVLSYPRGSIADGTPLVMGPGNGDLSTPWHVSFHHYLAGG
jgi:hypothetical protein